MAEDHRLAQYRQRILQETAYREFSGIPLLHDGYAEETPPIRIPLNRVYSRIQAFQKETYRISDIQPEISIRGEYSPETALKNILARFCRSGEEFYRQGKVYRELERPQPRDPLNALHDLRRLVVLGSPGAGKTSLLRYLAQKTACDADGPLPFLVSLQQYYLACAGGAEPSLQDFAFTQAARGDAELLTLFENTERRLWLLDDLDLFSSHHPDLASQIGQLSGDVVLTSRPTGYTLIGLETFTHFELLPMNAEEIKRFVTDYFTTLSEHCHVDWDWAEQQMLWIRDHLTSLSGRSTLAHTPLLLSYMLSLPADQQMQEFPQHQVALYTYYLKRLPAGLVEKFQTIPVSEARPLIPDQFSQEDFCQLALQCLCYLGLYWHIHYYEKRDIAQLTRPRISRALGLYLIKQRHVSEKIQEAATRAILDFWIQAGILKSWSEGHHVYLTFRHTLLQEYAAARRLADIGRQHFRRVWKFLLPRLHHPAWQSPLFMLVRLLDRSQCAKVIETLLHGVSPYEHTLHRDLRLAARLLNDGAGPPDIWNEQMLHRLGALATEDPQRQQIMARITYIAGVAALFGGSLLWFSWREAIITVGFWSLAWTSSCVRPLTPRIQGILALPQRFQQKPPQRAMILELFEKNTHPQTMTYLLHALHDSQAEVRKTAAEILGDIGEVEPVPALLDMLHDSRESLRRTAALALGKIGAVPRLLQALHDDQAEVRDAAAETLAHLDTAQTLPVLTLALKEGKDYVRQSAIKVLQQLETEGVLPSLIEALQDSDKTVRLVATETLGRLAKQEKAHIRAQVIPCMITMLEDSELPIRWAAAHALGQTRSPEVIPYLLDALRVNKNYVSRSLLDALLHITKDHALPMLIQHVHDPDADVRQACMQALGQIEHEQTLPHLLQALRDSDIAIRREAAEALGRIRRPEAMQPLLEGLDDDAWCVRWACTESLGKIGDSSISQHLISMMRDSHGYVCRVAAESLGKLGGTNVVTHLILALKSEKQYVQQAAQQALKQIGEAQTVPYLIAALKDEQEYVRKDAENALKQLGDTQAVPYLIAALRDTESYVRRASAEALGRIGSSQAVPALVELLEDQEAAVRSVAAEALGLIGDEKAIPPLLKTLNDPSSKVRRTVVKALGRIGVNSVVPDLLPLLEDASMNVRRTVVEALGRLGHPEAVPPLLNALHDPGWWIRWNAAYALGKIKDMRAVPPLIQTLKDPDENVRRASAEALGHIGAPEAVKPLMRALSDKSWPVRWAAIHALGQIGDPLPFLRLTELLNDDNEKVRWAAAEALGKLGDADAVPFLIQALVDRSWDVRKAAARSLNQLSTARVIPYLLEAMRRNHDYVRRTTTQALRHILDEQAIPYLIEALKDENRYIRKTAAENLIHLSHEQAIPHLIGLLNHHHWLIRQTAADVLAELAPIARQRKLLKRAARGLWWRLTDAEPVTISAFYALEQAANRLVYLHDSALSKTSSLVLEGRSKE